MEGYPNQNKIGDYFTIVSDNTGGNVAYPATFNFNAARGQHEEDVYYVRVTPGFGSSLSLLGAESVKEVFAIDLPLTGTPGVECRSGGPQSTFTIDFTFNNNLTGVGNVTTSCGTVASSTIDGTDPHRFIVDLAGVTCNEEDVTVTLTNVTDDQSNGCCP